MKRLLFASLIGLMLIGQAHASDLITRESAIALSKGAGLALIPLIARGTGVITECGQKEREDINYCRENIKRDKPGASFCAFDRSFKMPSTLYYFSPKTNIINRLLTCYGRHHKRHDSIINRLARNPDIDDSKARANCASQYFHDQELGRSTFDNKDTDYLYNTDKHRIYWNRFAAFLSGLLFCAGAARFANLNLPTLINNIMSSNKYTNMGIMAGSAASFMALAPHLRVPKEYK